MKSLSAAGEAVTLREFARWYIAEQEISDAA
jgi:hypothetical protein